MRKTGRKIIGLLLVACMTGSSFFGIGTQSVTDVVQAATDSEINIQIKPDAETFVNGGSVDFNGNNESQILIGRKRYFFSRYDLGKVKEQIQNNSMIVAKMELVSTITGTTTNVATVHIMTDHSWADGDLSQLTYRNMEGKWKDEVIVAEQGAGTGCELRMDVTGSYEELGFDTSYPNKLSYAVTASGSDGYDKSLLDEEGMSLVWDSTYLDVTLVPNTEANIAEKNMNSLKRASAMLAQLYNGRVLYEDIELPTSTYGVDTIEWKSTNSEYITDDGHVTRPDVDAIDDAYVTMIATFRKNDQLLKKEVRFIVAQMMPYIYPTKDGYVFNGNASGMTQDDTMDHIGNPNNGLGTNYQEIAAGRNRIGIIEIPLDDIDPTASNVVMHYTGFGGNEITANIYVAEKRDPSKDEDLGQETGATIFNEVNYRWKENKTGTTITMHKKDVAGTVDLTDVLIKEKRSGKDKAILIIYLTSEDAGSICSSRGDGRKAPYIICENLPVENRFEKVASDLKYLDGMTSFEDFELPVSYGNGIDVEWSSGNNDVLEVIQDEDKAIVRVHRPGKDSLQDAMVLLSAKMIYRYDTSQTMIKDFIVNIPKEQEYGADQRQSLHNLIQYGRKTLQKETNVKPQNSRIKPTVDENGVAVEAGDLGVLSKEAGDAFSKVLDEADAETEETKCFSQMQRIIRYGYEFMNSGLWDNGIYKTKYKNYQLYYNEGNELWYSEWRSMLRAYLWKANAALLVEPEMYPQSAKDALQVQIDRAEKALAGELHYGYNMNRAFNKAFDDEILRTTLTAYVRINRFNREQWGLYDATEWYRDQNILMDAFYSERAESVYEGTVQRNSWRTDKQLLTDNNSFAFIQGDLSKRKSDDIYSAAFEAYGTGDQGAFEEMNDVPDYSFEQIGAFVTEVSQDCALNNIVAIDDVEKNKKSIKIDFKPPNGGNNTINITDTVLQRIEDGKDLVTLEFQSRDLTKVIDKRSGYKRRNDNLPPIRLTYRMVSTQQFKDKYEDFLGKEKNWLTDAKGYRGDISNAEPGEYAQDKLDAANGALAELEQSYADNFAFGNYEEIGKAMVKLDDAIIAMRDSVALSTEIDPESNLFFNQEEWAEIEQRIKNDTDLKSFYEANKKIADQSPSLEAYKELYQDLGDTSLEGIKARDEKYRIWAGKSNLGLTAPKGTKQAYMTIELPSMENDEDSDGYAGHVWVDDITLSPSTVTEKITVVNNNFERGTGIHVNGWTFSGKGNAIGRWEVNNANLASNGRCSIYMENPDSKSSGVWISDPFDMPADSYSMSVNVKQHAKMINGVIFTMHYLNADGEEIGTPNSHTINDVGNVKLMNGISCYSYNTLYQACTIAYLVSKDKMYAEKAKYAMFHYLAESCQGFRGWTIMHARPAYGDVYGAVQIGRSLNTMGSCIPIIRQAGVLSEADEAELIRLGQMHIDGCSEVRDLNLLTPREAADNTSNWEFDMVHGSAMFAMAFSQHKDMKLAKRYIFNGTHFIKGQLLENMRDGVWPESIRYHGAFLGKMAIYAKVCKVVMNKDFWTDPEFSLTDSFKYYVMVQTPPYAKGNVATPPFGDHTLTSGSEMSWLGYYWDTVYDYDKELGTQMYETWVRAGRPSIETAAEDNLFQNFFGRGEFPGGAKAYEGSLNLKSNDFAKKFGLFVFRSNFGDKEKESYLATVMNPKEIGHGHPDQTSFIMYADSVPLVIDLGIGNYWAANKNLVRSSGSHSMVSYKNGADSVRDSLGTTELKSWYTSDKMDMIEGSTGSSIKTDGAITRTLNFIKDGFEAYVIWDRVTGATMGTRWSLPLLTETALPKTMDGNKIRADGFGDINLDIIMLEGNTDTYQVQSIIPEGEYPNRQGYSRPISDIIHIDNDLNDNYLTVLFPQNSRRGTLHTQEIDLPTKNERLKVYKLTHSGGTSVYVITNDSKVAETVTLGTDVQNLSEINGSIYKGGVVTVPGNSMMLLTTNVAVENGNGNGNEPGGSASQGSGGGGGSMMIAPPADSGNDSSDSSTGNESNGSSTNGSQFVAKEKTNRLTLKGKIKFKIENSELADSITYTSGNMKVAKVSKDGYITGKKKGKAVITAVLFRNGETTSVSTTVVVNKPVMTKTLTVRKGATKRIKARYITGADKITYKSSDKNIVRVSSKGRKVRGIEKGEAVITVTVKAGKLKTVRKVKVTVK